MSVVFGVVAAGGKQISSQLYAKIISAAGISGKRKLQVRHDNSFCFGYPDFDGFNRFAETEDGNYFLLMGGECFGILEVIDKLGCVDCPSYLTSPSLFLWYLYQNYGAEAFKWLDGHFCLCCYDRHHHEIILLNDSSGQHPIYFIENDDGFFFSSEYQIITSLSDFDQSINFQSIFEIFEYGMVLENRTLINGLRSLPYASEYRWKSPKDNSQRVYYHWDVSTNYKITIEKAADEIFSLMRRRMVERIEDGRITDLPLTGGYDTRFLLGLIPKHLWGKFKWHTNCSPYLDENQDRDVIIAKMLSEAFGLSHRIIHPCASENAYVEDGKLFYEKLRPMAEWFNINGHFSGYIRGKLGGQDGIFSGAASKRLRYISKKKRAHIKNCRIIVNEYRCGNNKLLFYYLNNICTFLNTADPLNSGKWVYPPSFFLQSIRTPFQDSSLLRYLLSLPPEYLKNGNVFLLIFQRHNPELFTVPFVANPFEKLADKKLLQNIKVLRTGIDYQTVRKRTWVKLFQTYLFSRTTWDRGIFSWQFFILLFIIWVVEYKFSDFPILGKIKNHWRYRHLMPVNIDQTFIRIEAWLRAYL